MTFAEARANAAGAVGALDARHLLAWAAGVDPGQVPALCADPLPAGARGRLDRAVAERLAGWSVAHVTGRALFWGREMIVTRDVLSPRPETETLIAAALAGPFEQLCDLGTGSGCIAVTLLAEREGATAVATDLSKGALDCARANAERHGVGGRLDLRRSDWWTGVEGSFDLVVSNPPYLSEAELGEATAEVRREPRIALTPGGDGLGAYRAICAGAVAALRPGGRVLLEVGPSQGRAVSALLAGAGFAPTHVHADMDGRDRVVEARAPA